MYFVVATYREGGKVVALKLYDSVKKELGMFHTRLVINSVRRDNTVVAGIEKKITSCGNHYLTLSKKLYNVSMLDQVDSEGSSLSGTNVVVPISVAGFGKTIKTTVVNSCGGESVLGYSEVLQAIENKTITGVRKSKTGLIFHSLCTVKGLSNIK